MRGLCIIGIYVAAGLNGAHAAPALDTAGATQCAIRGYQNDPDPKGTNVRAAPRANAAVLGHLPPRKGYEGSSTIVGVEFEIVGSKDGWLLIQNPEEGDLKGRGWISGRLVSFTIGSSKLLAGPDSDGEVVATLSGESNGAGYGPDSFAVLRVHGCQGKFAEVTVALPRSVKPPPGKDKPLHGWVRKVCSNQLTTCDPS